MSIWRYAALAAGFLAFGLLGMLAARLDPALGPTVVVVVGLLLGVAWPQRGARRSYALRVRRGAHRRQMSRSDSSRSLAG